MPVSWARRVLLHVLLVVEKDLKKRVVVRHLVVEIYDDPTLKFVARLRFRTLAKCLDTVRTKPIRRPRASRAA